MMSWSPSGKSGWERGHWSAGGVGSANLEKGRKTLTRYLTAQPLASGGAGEVFKAWDGKKEQWVALKFLHRDDPLLIERLFREAAAQQRLDHANICKVFEASRDEDGRPYIAMEYIDGPPLDQACATLTIEEKIALLAQTARAVHYAHGRGIVHRDLKPSNILVRIVDDGSRSPVIVDFGVALWAEDVSLTRTGEVLGTPAFMAPEQARGDSRSVDRRTDVYALGAVLYHLLAGRPPFEAETPVVLLAQIIDDQPPSPLVAQPDLPRDLCVITLKALEKEPRHRYDSALAFAEDLDRWLEGRTITARPLGRAARLARTLRRHPVMASVIGLAAVAVVLAGGLAVHSRWAARQQSLLARTLAIEEETLAGRVRLIKTLPRHDVTEELASIRSEVENLQSRVDSMGKSGRGPGMAAVGRCLLALGDSDAAFEALNQAVEAGFSPPEVEGALGQILAHQYEQALWEARQIKNSEMRSAEEQRAEQELKLPALGLLRKAQTTKPGRLELVLALIHRLEGDFEQSFEQCRAARLSAPWLYESYGEEAQALLNRADAEVAGGQMEEALADIEAAGERIEVGLDIGRSDSSLWLLEYQRLQRLVAMEATRDDARAEGVNDRAETACLKALEIEPHLAEGYRSLAWLLARKAAEGWWNWGEDPMENLDRALASAVRAVELAPESASARAAQGMVFLVRGRILGNRGEDPSDALAQAIESFEEAMTIDPTHPGALINSGQATYYLGDYAMRHGAQADRFFSEAVDIADRYLGRYPEIVSAIQLRGASLTGLAQYQASRGEDCAEAAEKAVMTYRRAIEVDPGRSSLHNNLGLALWVLAEVRESAGEDPLPWLEKTRASFERGLELRPDGVSSWANLGAVCESIAIVKIDAGIDPTADIDQGRKAVAEALARHPDDFFLERGMLEIAASRWAMISGQSPLPALNLARKLLKEGISRNPADGEAYFLLSEACLWHARWRLEHGSPAGAELTEGLQAADRAIEINGNDANAFAVRGELWRVQAASGEGGESARISAAEDCSKAWDLNPALMGGYCR